MERCKICGSYAINHNMHGRDGSYVDLCDVCFWRKRAEKEHVKKSKVQKTHTQPFGKGRKLNTDQNNNEINNEEKKIVSPLKAIRAHCKQCVGSFNEIKECGGEGTCPLFDFRFGKNPFRKTRKLTDEEREAAGERFRKAREANGTMAESEMVKP